MSGNRDEQRELAAVEALGRATPEELALLEEATAGDPALGRELDAYRATVTALEAGVAREVPSDDLFDRILAEIQEEPAARARLCAGARSGAASPRGAGSTACAGLALPSVPLRRPRQRSWSASSRSPATRPSPTPARRSPARTEFAAVSGEAEVFDTGEPGGTLVVRMTSVPPAPGGHHYEVWVLREGSEAMESVGEVSPTDGEAELEVELPGAGPFAAVDVSVEPDDGDPGALRPQPRRRHLQLTRARAASADPRAVTDVRDLPEPITLATGAEARLRGPASPLAVVCANGGQGRDVPGTWSASIEWLVGELAPAFPSLRFAEVRYRIKSWNRLDMCVEDALAAIEAAGGERTLLVGFSMGGLVCVRAAGRSDRRGRARARPLASRPARPLAARGEAVRRAARVARPLAAGDPGRQPDALAQGLRARASSLGVEGTYTKISRRRARDGVASSLGPAVDAAARAALGRAGVGGGRALRAVA